MPRALPDDDACERAGVDVPSEPDLEAPEPPLALARLGAMVLERWSLMAKLHRRLQEPKIAAGDGRSRLLLLHNLPCQMPPSATCVSWVWVDWGGGIGGPAGDELTQ